MIGHSISGQITPDSLIGTYAGEHWFKWEEDEEWTITNDTAYIITIDSNGCWVTSSWYGVGGTTHFETHYSFCYGNSDNLFTRFHPVDSLTIVYDDISQPPPNYHIYSKRFYGIKISDSILVHTVDRYNIERLTRINPNPFTDHLFIRLPISQNIDIKMIDMGGNELFAFTKNKTNNITINTSSIVPGVYILQLIINNYMQSYKIVKL